MPRSGRAAAVAAMPVAAMPVAAMLAVASAVAACAPRAATTMPPALARGVTVGGGTIVAIRPLAPARTAGGTDVRGSIFGALGSPAIADAADATPEVEFILREDGGQTVSVVQRNGQNLLPGEHVLLVRSDRVRLLHAGTPRPAGA